MPMEAMFVADVVEEHARVLHEAERRMKKEELLDDSSSGPFDAAKFAAHGPQVYTQPATEKATALVPFCSFSKNRESLGSRRTLRGFSCFLRVPFVRT